MCTRDDRPERVLVFGASGFIGSRIVGFLEEMGLPVEGYSSKTCNLLDKEAVFRTLEHVDESTSIVLCSAIGRMIEDSFDAMRKNLEMIHNVCLYDYHSGVRNIIFLSSTDIYGIPPQTLPIDENTFPKADSYYALSKYAGEKILGLNFKDICPVTVLRLPGIYGKGDRFRSIIGKFIHNALSGKEIVIYGNGEIRRDYVDVEDVCQVVYYFIQHSRHDVYNVATGNSCPLKEVLKAIEENIGASFDVHYAQESDGRMFDLVFDNAKIASAIPGFTFLDVKSGIRKYVSQLKD